MFVLETKENGGEEMWTTDCPVPSMCESTHYSVWCMYVRIRKNIKNAGNTTIDFGGCSHATKVARSSLVTSVSNPTKEKRRKYLLYVKRPPSNECCNVEQRKRYMYANSKQKVGRIRCVTTLLRAVNQVVQLKHVPVHVKTHCQGVKFG